MAGKVYLVGAGPGDPELLTLKGKRCLESADVVLYDRLISPAVLQWIPAWATAIDVGKTPANHRYRQDQINQLLIEYALTGKTVVRLKGGDPFVFGRGRKKSRRWRRTIFPLRWYRGSVPPLRCRRRPVSR